MHVDRVAQLQRALTSLQGASNRREETERKLRLQLENELRQEREKNNKSQCQSNVGKFRLASSSPFFRISKLCP